MTDRQKQLLFALVREYTRTALPVGSASLGAVRGFDVSPATIRNELALLEEGGYITQPHTSAGRIPTEKGFRSYINAMTDERTAGPPVRFKKPSATDPERATKEVARELAARAEEVVLVAFGPRSIYTTGLSYLLGQPEFEQAYERVLRISAMMDRLEDVVLRTYAQVPTEVTVWLGDENPFGEEVGTIVTRYGSGREGGMIALLGPVRMDYDRNYSLVRSAKEILEELGV